MDAMHDCRHIIKIDSDLNCINLLQQSMKTLKNTINLQPLLVSNVQWSKKHCAFFFIFFKPSIIIFYCCAKEICSPPGSNLINVNDKERKSLKVSTSLGTLPNAQHCHFNDMITAHKMTTKL